MKSLLAVIGLLIGSTSLHAAVDPIPLINLKPPSDALKNAPAMRFQIWFKNTETPSTPLWKSTGFFTIRSGVVGTRIKTKTTFRTQTLEHTVNSYCKSDGLLSNMLIQGSYKSISPLNINAPPKPYTQQPSEDGLLKWTQGKPAGAESKHWPKGTVTGTGLLLLIEHLKPSNNTVFSAEGFDPLVGSESVPHVVHLTFKGKQSRSKIEGDGQANQWILHKAEDPKPLMTFWTDENQKLLAATLEDGNRVYRRITPTLIESRPTTDDKPFVKNISNYSFARTFSGSNLKITGTWRASTEMVDGKIHLTDQFESNFRGRHSFVNWKSICKTNGPLTPEHFAVEEGHETHKHQTNASFNQNKVILNMIGHKGMKQTTDQTWTDGSVLRTTLARLVTRLEPVAGKAWRLDAIHDETQLIDPVKQQVIVCEGNDPWLQKKDAPVATRFSISPDNPELQGRRSTYWVDPDGMLVRVELADGLIQYIREKK